MNLYLIPILVISLTANGMLMLWFQTEVFLEYGRLLGLGTKRYDAWKLAAMQKYKDAVLQQMHKPEEFDPAVPADCPTCKPAPKKAKTPVVQPNLSWMAFMGTFEPKDGRLRTWFKKLSTCPYCIGFWFSLGSALAWGHWEFTLPAYFVALTIQTQLAHGLRKL